MQIYKKLFRLYRTIKHLKYKQFYYRFVYLAAKNPKATLNKFVKQGGKTKGFKLSLEKHLVKPQSFSNKSFRFLNQAKSFSAEIDWNYSKHGKLWAYNLNYFDYLHQEDMTMQQGISLIREFIESIESNTEGLEPYPISLRGINWIKFLSKHDITDPEINGSLYAQYKVLEDNLEYQYLGNHLLENGFSLLFAAFYFRDKDFLKTGSEIVLEELEEQILQDGAHFERSPMYHQIILERVLDLVNLLQNNREWKNLDNLLSFTEEKAAHMLAWLQAITFLNGTIPIVNDSAYGIAPSTEQLQQYAGRLGMEHRQTECSDSGYRMYRQASFELFTDVARIGPDYIPGHAHSDTLSFVLHVNEAPVFVDTGVSTYESNERRQLECSTRSHNTVMIAETEQSEVWGGFRVGRRAYPVILEEAGHTLKATHTGYDYLGARHIRHWKWEDKKIVITDKIESRKEYSGEAFLHVHPDREIIRKNGHFYIDESMLLKIRGATSVERKNYQFANGFNRHRTGEKLVIMFKDTLVTEINFFQ